MDWLDVVCSMINIECTPSSLVAEQSISIESDIGRSCEDSYQATGAFNFRVHTSVLVNGVGHLLPSSTFITSHPLVALQSTSSSPSISLFSFSLISQVITHSLFFHDRFVDPRTQR